MVFLYCLEIPVKPLRVLALLISLSFAAVSVAETKTKVAYLGGFSSLSTGTVLTDLNLEKGLKIFLKMNPEVEKSIEFVRFDNQGEAANTALEAKKIIDQNIKFIVGVSKSNHALVVAPLADENKILFITPQATNDKVTQNHPYVFRSCFSDLYQGRALAQFATQNRKAKKILIMTNVDTPYSLGLAQRFMEFVGDKASITELKYVPDGIKVDEIKATVEKVKPDLVFIPDYVNTAVFLIKEFYKIDPKLLLLGGDGWGGREVLDPAIEPLKGLNAYYTTLWSQDLANPKNQKFVKVFASEYPGDPSSISAATMYDALSIFWESFKAVKGPKTPDAVRAKLLSTTFSTTSGKISFPDPNNPTPKKRVVVNRLNEGKHELYDSY
jgi:branched-chain amino acid transport system substrate-binding protein